MAQINNIQLIEYELPYEFINELRVISTFHKLIKSPQGNYQSLYTLTSGYPFLITDENKLIIIEPQN